MIRYQSGREWMVRTEVCDWVHPEEKINMESTLWLGQRKYYTNKDV